MKKRGKAPLKVVGRGKSFEERLLEGQEKALDTAMGLLTCGKPTAMMLAAKMLIDLGKGRRPSNEVIDVRLVEIGVVDGKIVEIEHNVTPKGPEDPEKVPAQA